MSFTVHKPPWLAMLPRLPKLHLHHGCLAGKQAISQAWRRPLPHSLGGGQQIEAGRPRKHQPKELAKSWRRSRRRSSASVLIGQMARKLHVSRSSVRERLPSLRCRLPPPPAGFQPSPAEACKDEQSDAAHEGSNSCIILAPMKTVPNTKHNKTRNAKHALPR